VHNVYNVDYNTTQAVVLYYTHHLLYPNFVCNPLLLYRVLFTASIGTHLICCRLHTYLDTYSILDAYFSRYVRREF